MGKHLLIGIELFTRNPEGFGASAKQVGIGHRSKGIAQRQGYVGIALNDVGIVEHHQILALNGGNRTHLQQVQQPIFTPHKLHIGGFSEHFFC